MREPITPKCRDCGKRPARITQLTPQGIDGHQAGPSAWLCASCEYLRMKPDAPLAKPLPRERRPKALQRERLFEVDP